MNSFAVCHIGANTEAGSDTAYVKFGAAQPGVDAPQHFEKLLDAIDALARARGAGHVLAGVNTARSKAYGFMLEHGFQTTIIGIAMHQPNEPGYNRPDCFVIDDLR